MVLCCGFQTVVGGTLPTAEGLLSIDTLLLRFPLPSIYDYHLQNCAKGFQLFEI